MNKIISIAVDGPAGAGKSTIAKKVAYSLNVEYIDTGAMYRALTLKVKYLGIDPKKEEQVIQILENTSIDFKDNHIFLDGKLVDEEIRKNTISQTVSYIAKIKEVRKKMVDIQKEIAREKSVIMDGRDIGTVVIPNATYKFFLTATVEERASRRYKELIEKNSETKISLEEITKDIEKRDFIDSNRKIGPLKKADDAIVIDTTKLTINESVETIISYIRKEGV